MPTDRQKICRCGLNVGNLTNDIRIMTEHLKKLNMTETSTYIPALRISINDIYRNIRNIEDNCGIDARTEEGNSTSVSNKVDAIDVTKDPLKFDETKVEIIDDLSRIRYGIMNKIENCSK